MTATRAISAVAELLVLFGYLCVWSVARETTRQRQVSAAPHGKTTEREREARWWRWHGAAVIGEKMA